MSKSKLPTLILDKHNLPEFIGQIIDTIEDFCDENQIIWPSEDRDLEIKALREAYPNECSGKTNAEIASIEGLAIIYGEDYDTISAPIEAYFTEKLEKENTITSIPEKDINTLVEETLDEFSNFIIYPDSTKVYEDKKENLKKELIETFKLWDLIH